MKQEIVSITNLIKNVLFDIFITILVSAIVGYINIYLAIVAFILIAVGFTYFRKYHRKLKLLKAGLEGYYYSFPLIENPKIWKEETNITFKYLGISADSILEFFLEWINSLSATDSKNFYFLLMDPESDSLARQICYEKGLDPKNLTDETKQNIDQYVVAVRGRIRSSIDILKSTHAFRQGRLKIKLHNEFIPWWLYIFDDEKVFLGILKKGERSSNAPLLIITRNKDYPSIFDAFLNYWNSMWENAKDV